MGTKSKMLSNSDLRYKSTSPNWDQISKCFGPASVLKHFIRKSSEYYSALRKNVFIVNLNHGSTRSESRPI